MGHREHAKTNTDALAAGGLVEGSEQGGDGLLGGEVGGGDGVAGESAVDGLAGEEAGFGGDGVGE